MTELGVDVMSRLEELFGTIDSKCFSGNPPPLPQCFGSNSTIDSDDVIAWLTGYLWGNNVPDTNSDGQINSFEFGYLLKYWEDGCE